MNRRVSFTAVFIAAALSITLLPSPAVDANQPSLATQLAMQVFAGGNADAACPDAVPERRYNVVAIEMPIVYNKWGDLDPHGRLFVLAEQEDAIRADVASKLAAAGLDTVARVVANPTQAPGQLGYVFPTGVGGAPNLDPVEMSDLVQPFIVRARLGECVTFDLTNKLAEPVSIKVNAAPQRAGMGSVLGQSDPDLTLPGETHAYTVYLPALAGMEGAHYLHSMADPRFQTRHGLFGALVAEPADATWRAPDGSASDVGQEAMILRPGAPDFRENVVIMHDEIELVDKRMRPLPILSSYGEYGPGSKGINLRAEPFMNRFAEHDARSPEGSGELDRGHDKSQGYSSYTYGDPGTFIPRGYLGDPTKFRLVNGVDQHHVFHLHGGGVRWRSSPVSEDTQFAAGFVKDNPVVRAQSERIDVQSIGPGESFNAEIEGGAGGTQQSVGDFLFHCHIVEHYVAGMWSFWRVFNTLQAGLAELPDRLGGTQAAVTSLDLLGTTLPNGTIIDASVLNDWLSQVLPPPGVAGPDDAAVWDWTVEQTPSGPLVKGEPETEFEWANYASETPGERPDLMFDPITKRPAYPMLSPHLGKRPPFAPGHGPAPYLGGDADGNHPDGLAPHHARPVEYKITAISVPVTYGPGDVDPDGQVFALAEDVPNITSGAKDARNLVIRANVGDKVDVTLTSALDEGPSDHSKVNMHIHLVQFDVQASDGVITGFNYEQSVRPATTTGTGLAAAAIPGDVAVTVADGDAVAVGTLIGIGLTQDNLEIREIVGASGNVLTLDEPLVNAHAPDERVGNEFVRYRWYADVELGTVYWHDHVDGLNSWRHGLFGALIVEPRGSEWRDPYTGAQVREGPVVDIVGPQESYREMVVEFQDRSARVDGRDLASFNLRSAPFDKRDAALPLSSTIDGDPSTGPVEAYAGDPVKVRLLYGANADSKAVGTFSMPGHRFAYEPYNPGSRTIDTVSFGISAQHNFVLECGAGSCLGLPGDYLYHMAQPELIRAGAWGIMRVHDTATDLLPLPGLGYGTSGTFPSGTDRHYNITALEADVVYNEQHEIVKTTRLFATSSDASAILAGTLRPEPLVLRALPGEVVEVSLTNNLDVPVGLHAGLVLSDPNAGYGIPVGMNTDALVAPGDTGTYRWFADRELGAVRLSSFAAPDQDTLDGLYGALVVEPAGSSFADATGTSTTLTMADGESVVEQVLLYASDDPAFQASVMPYTVDVQGIVSINYRTEPLAERAGGRFGPISSGGQEVGGQGVHTCQLNTESCNTGVQKEVRGEVRNPVNPFLFSSPLFGDPETPVIDAASGQRVVVRAIGGAGDQLQVYHQGGHYWAKDPLMAGSQLVDAQTIGPNEVVNAWFETGSPGDYLYGTHRFAFLEGGAWGMLRVS